MALRFLKFSRYNAFENMAIDEAIFRETIKNKRSPTIRFYGWRPPAVSIGYFQDPQNEINLMQCRKDGVDVVRRLTGGKAVYHNDEITYSVVAGVQEDIFPGDIYGAYKVISNCLIQGLAHLGIKAELAEAGRAMEDADLKACCFSIPSRNELLVSGCKICGSAQMRTKDGFLQHGSLLLSFDPVKTAGLILPAIKSQHLSKLGNSVTAINEEINADVDIGAICNALKKGFADVLGIEITEQSLTEAEIILKNELLKKYADPLWNMSRRKECFK